jgi:hypothetical protein
MVHLLLDENRQSLFFPAKEGSAFEKGLSSEILEALGLLALPRTAEAQTAVLM